ncbi:hypothetical protein AAMO2058_001237200 [Amorphochlora amoebiformis]
MDSKSFSFLRLPRVPFFLTADYTMATQVARGFTRKKSWPSLVNIPSGQIYPSIEEYVKDKGGKRVIRRILIANNGIAAVKGIRSMQKWAYETFGDEKLLQFIAMATPDDIKVNAEYIHLANEVVNVPGGSNNNNYANVSLIIDIAQRLSADAVWAGWGHASENPKLPDGLAAHNRTSKQQIVWIGPSGKAMRALGDKIGSSIIAQSAGVPCIGWSGSGLTVDLKSGGEIPSNTYEKACVSSAQQAVEVCRKVRYPVMIKASEGGGGKGIRMCHSEEEVKDKYGQVVGEVPGSPVFIMKLAPTCRHLEVQLLGDEWGNAIAVMGRDCSIQRRHQKIIEEGPVVAAKPKTWREMENSAVRLAKAVGYVGAGTVEYLYTQEGTYFFLELNPRLQVEHPVTELISGVNLPAAQLQIAMGLPLASIPHIRRFYGQKVEDISPINFDRVVPVVNPMHVIACRITAENPEMEFQPTSGTIFHLNFRSTPNVWGYFSVSSNGGVHQFADSQFGHLFATAKTRESARRNMVQALRELTIQGEIRTTVEYLCHILETNDFKDNQVSTTWLERIMRNKSISDIGKLPAPLVVTLGALYKAWTASSEARISYLDCLERGQVPPMSEIQPIIETNPDLIYQMIKYKTTVTRSGRRHFDIQLRGSEWTASVEVHELADNGLLAILNGRRYIVYGREQPDGVRLSIDSKTYMFSREYDPTRLIAEMQGKLIRFTVEDGGQVRKNKAFAEMEVMKMYLPLIAPENGTITHCKPEGAILEGGDLIARLELDDPSSVQTAEIFKGSFPTVGPPQALGNKPNILLEDALTKLRRILAGYKITSKRRAEAVKCMMDALRDPLTPSFQFETILSTISAKLPAKLVSALTQISDEYKRSISSHRFHWEKSMEFPASEMLEAIQTHLVLVGGADASVIETTAQPVTDLLHLYDEGNHAYAVHEISGLLNSYYDVASHFKTSPELVIKTLRREHTEAPERLLDIARAQYQSADRIDLVNDLFRIISGNLRPLLPEFAPVLRKISQLEGPDQTRIAIQARRILLSMREPSFEHRKMEVQAVLKTADEYKDYSDRVRIYTPLISRPSRLENPLLMDCMTHRNPEIRKRAMEAYVLRNHADYIKDDVHLSTDFGILTARFSARLDAKTAPGGLYADIVRSAKRKLSNTPNVLTTVAFFSDPEILKRSFKYLYPNAETAKPQDGKVNTLYLLFKSNTKDDNLASAMAREFVQTSQKLLVKLGLARVTLVVGYRASSERLFTFRARDGFKEDTLIRHLRPLLAEHIDLRRMECFSVRLAHSDGSTKVLEAIPKNRAVGRDGYDGRRLFVRRLVQHLSPSDLKMGQNSNETAEGDPAISESPVLRIISALEIAMGDEPNKYRNNNVGLLIPAPLKADRAGIVEFVRQIMLRHAQRMFSHLNIQAFELSCTLVGADKQTEKFLVVATNPSGFFVELTHYIQADGKFKQVGGTSGGALDGKPSNHPYQIVTEFQRQREAAKRVGTVYVYDFLILFEVAMRKVWAGRADEPKEVFRFKELILAPAKTPPKHIVTGSGVSAEKWTLVETKRPIGQNKIAMVAFQLTLMTPEYPQGRDVILIANDIAIQAGSFGVLEDVLFNLASQRSRTLGIPRFYFSVNSGARIGLAKEVMSKFRVAWNQNDVSRGPAYLYLSPNDYKELKDSVTVDRVEVNGKTQYRIRDIIGKKNGLGVENLSGSGLIAGETSKAYDDVFTLTYCCGRSVGIGAYLARLGQRVVQKSAGAPILLTGHFALNKLLGRRVYTSNDQLGGIDVMHNNGVTHLVCQDDLEGVAQCIEWLSYVPESRGKPFAIDSRAHVQDPIDRKVTYVPPSGPYDTICLIAGETKPDSKDGKASWSSGFFDKGSFMELMSNWAKTVICGRARLGGMPVGVIAVTTKMVEQTNPADPAAPDSKEIVHNKAGQVWYPDSAFKTAQAIRDMDSEDLPLVIFANWRGFSGGMRDMFDEVLKFGSYIVDALVAYKNPVSVYLPPHATLRGGAWVVVDSQINPFFMRMYSDPRARGGILEVEATCGIKFRRKDELKTAYRLDTPLQDLKEKLDSAESSDEVKEKSAEDEKIPTVASPSSKQELLNQIRDREQKVLPSFHQAAAMFVDLHDTPGRMLSKGVIEDIVEWESSRKYFYWNIRRRMTMVRLMKMIKNANPKLDWFDCESRLKDLLKETGNSEMVEKAWSNDEKMCEILTSLEPAVRKAVPKIEVEYIAQKAKDQMTRSRDKVEWLGGLLKELKLSKQDMARLKTWVDTRR